MKLNPMDAVQRISERVRASWPWLLAEAIGLPLLLALGLLWTRLPDKHVWQIALTLILPLLVLPGAAMLLALACSALNTTNTCTTSNTPAITTADQIAKQDEHPDEQPAVIAPCKQPANRKPYTQLLWATLWILLWATLFTLLRSVVNSYEDQSWQWIVYLNAQAPASMRARLLGYVHLQQFLTVLLWLLRWVLAPALVLPFAFATTNSSTDGSHWRRARILLCDLRWWCAALLLATVAVLPISRLFAPLPHGSVHAQELRVGLKLAGSFLLFTFSWIGAQIWLAVLWLNTAHALLQPNWLRLGVRLRQSERWLAALAALSIAATLPNLLANTPQAQLNFNILQVSLRLLVALATVFVFLLLVRSLALKPESLSKVDRGVLAGLGWLVAAVALLFAGDSIPSKPLLWLYSSLFIPTLALPFVASATLHGWRQPWRATLQTLRKPRWLLGAPLTLIAMDALINPVLTMLLPKPDANAGPGWVVSSATNAIHYAALAAMLAWLVAQLEEEELRLHANQRFVAEQIQPQALPPIEPTIDSAKRN